MKIRNYALKVAGATAVVMAAGYGILWGLQTTEVISSRVAASADVWQWVWAYAGTMSSISFVAANGIVFLMELLLVEPSRAPTPGKEDVFDLINARATASPSEHLSDMVYVCKGLGSGLDT